MGICNQLGTEKEIIFENDHTVGYCSDHGVCHFECEAGKFVVTVQQVCASTALTVRKCSGNRHKSICEANIAWICARNYEGTE